MNPDEQPTQETLIIMGRITLVGILAAVLIKHPVSPEVITAAIGVVYFIGKCLGYLACAVVICGGLWVVSIAIALFRRGGVIVEDEDNLENQDTL